MIPYVTLMNLCCDARLLVRKMPSIAPLFVDTFDDCESEVLLGSIAPVDEEMIWVGLVELHEDWNLPDRFPLRHRSYPGILERERRLAFCLGGLVQLASGLASEASREACFDKDSVVLCQAILRDEREAFEAFLTAHRGGGDDLQEAFVGFILALFMRSLAEAHTLIPDMVDIHSWMDSLIEGTPALERRIRRFAETVYPTGSSQESAWVEPEQKGFYDAGDPALIAAQDAGNDVTGDVTAGALEVDANLSAYGKALCRCLASIEGISQAWEAGELTDRPELLAG